MSRIVGTKRPPRPPRDLNAPPDDVDVLMGLLHSTVLYDLAAAFDVPRRGPAGGNAYKHPPIVMLLFGMMAWGWGGLRQAEGKMRRCWAEISEVLGPLYPGWECFDAGGDSLNRLQYARFRDKHGLDDGVYNELSHLATVHASESATAMGQLVESAGGSLTYMSRGRLLAGDGVVFSPRYDGAPGDLQLNAETGELEQVRFDPDARYYETEGGQKVVYGIKFVHIKSYSVFEREDVLLSMRHQPEDQTGGEAALAMEMIREIRPLLPGAQGVVWDKAFRGVHIDELYEMELQSVVKVSLVGGKTKTRRIGPHRARIRGREEHVDVMTDGGAVCIQTTVRGAVELVRCEKVKVALRRGRTKVRWYGTYRIPDRAPVPPRLRGATFTIRFNGRCAGDPRNLNRAEVIRPVAEGDGEWQTLFSPRNGTESVNSWIKGRLFLRRAPALGAQRQRFEFLCMQVFVNIRALVAYRRRLGLPEHVATAA